MPVMAIPDKNRSDGVRFKPAPPRFYDLGVAVESITLTLLFIKTGSSHSF